MQAGERPGGGNIAMLGPPASGKTTFLAALSTALMQHEPSWQLVGEDPASSRSLIRLMALLDERGAFPAATADLGQYRWSLVGPARETGRRFGGRRRSGEVKIGLNLIDLPGMMATAAPIFEPSGQLAKTLVSTSAIVFLYDPVREYERGDTFSYADRVFAAMASEASQLDGRLPHYVAVCITKFDEPRVLATAERMGMLEFDPEPPRFPRVPDDLAREFFTEICRASRSDNSSLLPGLLARAFYPDRIRFFATSAIGFYINPRTESYDPGDFQNLVPGGMGIRIRGPVRPINVVEPLLWLSRHIASNQGLRR